MLSMALPVTAFILIFFAIARWMLPGRDRFHGVLIAASLTVIVAAVVLAWTSVPSESVSRCSCWHRGSQCWVMNSAGTATSTRSSPTSDGPGGSWPALRGPLPASKALCPDQ